MRYTTDNRIFFTNSYAFNPSMMYGKENNFYKNKMKVIAHNVDRHKDISLFTATIIIYSVKTQKALHLGAYYL